MKNLDILFIRACKSSNPRKRLKSVYRRFYGDYEHGNIFIIHKLVDVAEEYLPVNVSKLVQALDPDENFRHLVGGTYDYRDEILRFFINHFRFTLASKLKENGFISPTRFSR